MCLRVSTYTSVLSLSVLCSGNSLYNCFVLLAVSFYTSPAGLYLHERWLACIKVSTCFQYYRTAQKSQPLCFFLGKSAFHSVFPSHITVHQRDVPYCHQTSYGCCPDGVTTASGSHGQGCYQTPSCTNSRYTSVHLDTRTTQPYCLSGSNISHACLLMTPSCTVHLSHLLGMAVVRTVWLRHMDPIRKAVQNMSPLSQLWASAILY